MLNFPIQLAEKERNIKRSNNIILLILAFMFLTVHLSCSHKEKHKREPVHKFTEKTVTENIPPELKKMVEKLYSQNPTTRGRAAYELGKMGEKAAAAVPNLIGILYDDSPLTWMPELRSTSPGIEAAKALGEIKDPRAVESLIAALKDENLCKSGAESLGKIKDPRAVEPLIAALDKGYKVHGIATVESLVKALVQIGAPAVDPLITVLMNEHFKSRALVAKALGEIKDPRAVEPLIVALKDENPGLRQNAAEALGKIKNPKAIEPLISLIKKEYTTEYYGGTPQTVRIIIKALVNIGEPTIGPLISLLKDKDRRIQLDALSVLDEITNKPFGINYIEWKEWWDSRVAARERMAYSRAAAKKRISHLHSLESLEPALKDKEKFVRLAAIEALANKVDEKDQAVKALIPVLQDPDEDVRVKAVEVFWELNRDKKISFLRRTILGDSGIIKGRWQIWAEPPLDRLIEVFKNTNLSFKGLRNPKIIETFYPIFIDRGETGEERILIDVLNASGNREMAYDFLNCGNAELAAAAKSWARRHGYELTNVRGDFDLHRWGRLR